MTKFIKIIAPFLMLAFFSSCKKDTLPRELARDTCNCIKKEGIESLLSGNFNVDLNHPESIPDCLKENTARLSKALKKMNQDERVEFTKELTKEIADTDCATILLGFVPYDDVLKELNAISD